MRVFLADDQPEVCSALRLVLEQQPGMLVTGEARDQTSLWKGLCQTKPDLLLLDWELPGTRRDRLLVDLRRHFPWLQIVALSAQADVRPAALAAGANAFVSKGEAPDHLLEALAGLARA